MLKRNEQLFSLLAVTVALCPRAQRLLDESVANALMAKHRDIISAIGRNDGVDALRDRFAYACPRFINPDMPNYSNATELNHHNDVFWQAQAAKFAAEVEKRKHVPSIRQYLSLYAVRVLASGIHPTVVVPGLIPLLLSVKVTCHHSHRYPSSHRYSFPPQPPPELIPRPCRVWRPGFPGAAPHPCPAGFIQGA